MEDQYEIGGGVVDPVVEVERRSSHRLQRFGQLNRSGLDILRGRHQIVARKQSVGAGLSQQLEDGDRVREAKAKHLRDVTGSDHSIDMKHIGVCCATEPLNNQMWGQ